VTFVNQTAQTIWVAAAPNANTPLAATGWVLPAAQSVTISTPNNLNTRFWGRTGCVFNSGCISACARLGGDQYCCRGQWSSRSACDPTKWPVDYAEVFKSAEPYAYSYVDDDATSVFTCSGVCDYRITFGLSH
jgi:hypothetical protein